MRRMPSIAALLSVLYLEGISTNAFQEVLKALLGERAGVLSPGTIVRLKRLWEEEYKVWAERDLEGNGALGFWAALEEEFPRAGSNDAGFTRQPIFLINFPRRYGREQRN
jgi:hypothetical protein